MHNDAERLWTIVYNLNEEVTSLSDLGFVLFVSSRPP
jgi:hypothetical protein